MRPDDPFELQATDDFIVRLPGLPVEAFLESCRTAGEDLSSAKADPDLLYALAVADSELVHEIHSEDPAHRMGRKAGMKLRQYIARMSTRPTPFGTFAGIAAAKWGERARLEVGGAFRTHTRPDMRWLLDFVSLLLSDPAIHFDLKVVRNPLAFERRGRVFLQYFPGDDPESPALRSVRAGAAVRQILVRARAPVSYSALAAELIASSSSDPETVCGFLSDLITSQFLLTDLIPPVTCGSPAEYVAERLATLAAGAETLPRFRAFLAMVANLDTAAKEERLPLLQRVYTAARSLVPSSSGPVVQVDAEAVLRDATLPVSIAREAARAAGILLSLSPYPQGPAMLAAYRRLFQDRFGQEAEVSLTECFLPEFGIGDRKRLIPQHNSTQPFGSPVNRYLLALASSALASRKLAVDLNLSDLKDLAGEPGDPPESLELNVMIAATSAERVEQGDFRLIVAPLVGSRQAGRSLGRFSHMLDGRIGGILNQLACREAERRPHAAHAELACAPVRPRSWNVAVHRSARRFELVVNGMATAPESNVVYPDDVLVGLRNDRFYLKWTRTGQEIRVSPGHLLTADALSPMGRFLCEVSQDGVTQLNGFVWGDAEQLPFLPRVQVGRIVLRAAQWRIDAHVLRHEMPEVMKNGNSRALKDWAQRWRVPRYVYYGDFDVLLLLDLEAEANLDFLAGQIRRSGDRVLVLIECLTPPGTAWIRGANGHFLAEFVIPFVRRRAPENVSEPIRLSMPALPVETSRRLRFPGSDWLYIRLYYALHLEEEVLGDEVREFCTRLTAEGRVVSWFFVRYEDTLPHIRLRLHGRPDILWTSVVQDVNTWTRRQADDGVLLKFAYDTYEREIERYGGDSAIDLTERVFHADSLATVEILRLLQIGQLKIDRTTLAVLTADSFLESLGLDRPQRLAVYRAIGGRLRSAGEEYRRRKTLLLRLLSELPDESDLFPGSDLVFQVLGRRRSELSAWRESSDGPGTARIAGSLVHMHYNRLLNRSPQDERIATELLYRSTLALSRATGK